LWETDNSLEEFGALINHKFQEPTAMSRAIALLVLATVPLLLIASFGKADDSSKPKDVLDFKLKNIDGKDVNLADYKGDVLLIVNTASQCGYTPQYEGLEAIYEKYNGKGFKVLAFPANEFGQQEPGTDAEIKTFCKSKYNVAFPVFSKIVVKGAGIHPLYQFLTSKETNPKFAGDIGWNFTKFLVNRKGEVIARWASKVEPESKDITTAIEGALAESK
jgi:glutathione peroxidase